MREKKTKELFPMFKETNVRDKLWKGKDFQHLRSYDRLIFGSFLKKPKTLLRHACTHN